VSASDTHVDGDGEGLLDGFHASITVAEGASLSMTGADPTDGFTCSANAAAGRGAQVIGSSTLSLTRCEIGGAGAVAGAGPFAGVQLSGGHLILDGASIHGSAGTGILVDGDAKLTVAGGSQITGSKAEGLLVQAEGEEPISLSASTFSANGSDDTLAPEARAGVRLAQPSGGRVVTLDGMMLTGNMGAGLLLEGAAAITLRVSKSSFSTNGRQGFLTTSTGATVDFGCAACPSTGDNVFSMNAASALAFQEQLADFQDARAPTAKLVTVRGMTFDGIPFGPAQSFSDPAKLIALPNRWGFLKELTGSAVVLDP
jgi:hypothetical protein